MKKKNKMSNERKKKKKAIQKTTGIPKPKKLNTFNETDYSVLTEKDVIKALEKGPLYLLYIFKRCHRFT